MGKDPIYDVVADVPSDPRIGLGVRGRPLAAIIWQGPRWGHRQNCGD